MDESTEKKDIYKHISKYAKSNWISSIWNLFTTCILLYIFFNYEEQWLLLPIFSLTLLRTFVIFHDMAHGSFFASKTLNYYIALLLGTIVVTPFSHWTNGHNHHHRHSNKLDRKQYSQTSPWDTELFKSKKFYEKLAYKFAYGKYTLFTIIPWLYFIILQHITAFWYENLMHALYLVCMIYFSSFTKLLYISISYWFAGVLGFLLFHAQHTFSGVYKEKEKEWDYFKNGLYGCSFIQVPWYLKYFTCGIEYHHIHHLNTLVPSYNLKKCHDESGELFNNVNKVSFIDILKSTSFSLYDIENKKFEDVYHH